jgi:hypothetical protein
MQRCTKKIKKKTNSIVVKKEEITIPTHEKKIIKHPSQSKCFIMEKMPTSSSVAFLSEIDEREEKKKKNL